VTEIRVAVQGSSARLSALAWSASEPGFLLLHGAAGHAGEWRSAADWLTRYGRVLALDLRGHGLSERVPSWADFDALVDDALAAAATFELSPVIVGQSLGGAIAIALAARAPERVRAAVVVEASPGPDPEAAEVVRRWLASWPTPFPSRQEAEGFFGGGRPGAAWADGLVETAGGLMPSFDPEVIDRLMRSSSSSDLWAEWRSIACPALVMRGGRGDLSEDEARRMSEANSNARVAIVPDAGHDVHLDNSSGFRTVIEPFVAELLA
jgi:pimeloyl-ACP methyl ester carboxylesterase